MRGPHTDLQRWLFLAGGVCCLIIALGVVLSFSGKFGSDTRPARVAADLPEFAEPNAPQNASDAASPVWVVYVTGAVMFPGVYEVPENSRVDDAVKRAGGFSTHADPEGINLAARLLDGVHIRVPEKGEALGMQIPQTSTVPSDTGVVAARQHTEKINVNTCSEEALLALPGIGPVLARRIIDHREKNGPFRGIEEIRNVGGIGEKRFEAIREYIVVSDF